MSGRIHKIAFQNYVTIANSEHSTACLEPVSPLNRAKSGKNQEKVGQ